MAHKKEELTPECTRSELGERLKEQKWLVMMVGIPGSGKTTFASRLAETLGAYRLNMDLLRGELFQTANRQEQILYDQTQTAELSQDEKRLWRNQKDRQIVAAYRQNLEAELGSGQSVVVDSSSDRRDERDELRQVAEKFDALPIVVWMQTPYELAINRATNRELARDSYPFAKDYLAREEIDRCLGNLDRPSADEATVLVDGQGGFDQQLAAFASCAAEQLPPPNGQSEAAKPDPATS